MFRKLLKWGVVGIGLLVTWIIVVLVASAVVKSRVPVSLATSAFVYNGGGSLATASGTWVIEGEKQAFPLQTTKITCEKALNRCTSSTAMVMFGDQLTVDVDFYDVISWEKSRIVFVDDAPVCVQYVYTIDLVTKVANGVRQKRKTPTIEAYDCSTYTNELHLSLKSGFHEFMALEKEAMPWFGLLAVAPLKLLGK